MKTIICDIDYEGSLECYRAGTNSDAWELVISGYWSQSPYHSGHIAYFVQRTQEGVWVMNSIERNAELDSVTQDDVDEGALNDDQIQAMWGMTLEEAQSQSFEQIVAVGLNAAPNLTSLDASRKLYAAVCEADGKVVDEPDLEGLIE